MAQFYGNEQIQHTLHQMLLRDRAPHGFLFYGETGLGKKTLAKQFLAELLCTGTEKPCGSCKSCKMLADGVHPTAMGHELIARAWMDAFAQLRRL